MDSFNHHKQCPACGHKGFLFWGWPHTSYNPHEYVLKRTCRRCGFMWDESALHTAHKEMA